MWINDYKFNMIYITICVVIALIICKIHQTLFTKRKLNTSTATIGKVHFLIAFLPLPAWVLRCVDNAPDCVNRCPQISHSYGFSPVWMRMCAFKPCESVKPLLHVLQMCLRSPVWLRTCAVKWLEVA